MKILGIDPGTATVGWAVVEEKNGTTKAVAFGHLSTSPKNTAAERLHEISRDLEKIVALYNPEEAAIEKLFFFKNVKTVISVAEARGSILLTMSKSGLIIAEYTPLQVKQSLTGYGRAEKRQMQEMVKNILKLSAIPKPDDTADALAIALCHLNSRKLGSL